MEIFCGLYLNIHIENKDCISKFIGNIISGWGVSKKFMKIGPPWILIVVNVTTHLITFIIQQLLQQSHTHLMTFMYPFAAATWSAVAPVLGCFFSLTDLLFSHLLASCNIWFSSSERAASASTPNSQGMF